LNYHTVEALAYILFLLSTVTALSRIEKKDDFLGQDAKKALLLQKRATWSQVKMRPGDHFRNESNGDIINRDQAAFIVNTSESGIKECKELMDIGIENIDLLGKSRKWLLLAGFLLMMIARIWAAYSTTPASRLFLHYSVT